VRVALLLALERARAHPRHLALAALVTGVGLGPFSAELALAVGVVLGALIGRPGWMLLAAALALLGGVGARERLASLDRTHLRPELGSSFVARAVLLEQPRPGRFDATALARLENGVGRGERVVLHIPRRVRWPGPPTGAVLAVDGRLAPLTARDDYQRQRGAHARLSLYSGRWSGERRGGLAGYVDTIRGRAEAGLEHGLPGPEAALARGMVLGQDERLSDVTRQEFRTSGLSHVLAASGQNVVLLAALAAPLLRLAGLGLRARLLVLLALIGLYVPLAGAGPPIQRAGIMGAAGVAAALAGRPASRWYALGLAALGTLVLNPRVTSDPGWQLSFAAVLAIVLLAPRLRESLERTRMPAALAEATSLTAAATVGTAPLIALHFGQFSLVSLPANVLAAPVVAPIMWLGMLSSALAQVALAPAAIINGVGAYPLAALSWLAHASAGLPHASVPVALPGPLAVLGVYLALTALVLVRRARGPLGALAVLFALGSLLWPGGRPAPPAGLTVSFLDVGQGDATLIQDGGHAVLVDTGPPGGPILERLAHAGVRKLDALVVTHAQADHEGGAAAVLRSYPVGVLLDGGQGTPSPEHVGLIAEGRRRRVRALAPDAGQALRAGALELDVLWPRAEPSAAHAGEDPNQRAIVAEVQAPGLRLLLPADAESDVTSPLELPTVDVLKVAHHGSADPGLPDLVERLRPQVAVIEVGRHNSYGHPAAQALGALRSVPYLFRTDRDGTVRLTVKDGRMRVSTHA